MLLLESVNYIGSSYLHLSLNDILRQLFQVKELAEKARAGKLKPDEFQGGTFRLILLCYTNLVLCHFTPVLLKALRLIINLFAAFQIWECFPWISFAQSSTLHRFVLRLNSIDILLDLIKLLFSQQMRCFLSVFLVLVFQLLQAGILAVGRGNKVVEPVVGSDGKIKIILCLLCLISNIWCDNDLTR